MFKKYFDTFLIELKVNRDVILRMKAELQVTKDKIAVYDKIIEGNQLEVDNPEVKKRMKSVVSYFEHLKLTAMYEEQLQQDAIS